MRAGPVVVLRDMSPAEFEAFWARLEIGYVADLTTAMTAEAARIKARQDRERLLPDGLDTAGNRLLRVENERDDVVGQAWLGLHEPRTGSAGMAWIYDLHVEEAHRRRGYARAVMAALEAVARQAGALRLGLNVFGDNPGAIALYESCGYEVTTQQMAKSLGCGS